MANPWKPCFVSDDIIRPQPKQALFLRSAADIAIYGGAAFSGKTMSLLMACLYHHQVSDFGAVVFRREARQISNEGGLRDTALSLYGTMADYRAQPSPHFVFPSGYRISFAHLNQEADVVSWHGSQIGLLCFDELCMFTGYQFWYMLSRNRSVSGVKPRCLATCNPDPDSWVADFIAWWIDQDTGFPIAERSGVLRYFLRKADAAGNIQLLWGSTRDAVLERVGFEKPSQIALVEARDRADAALRRGENPDDGTEAMRYWIERKAIKSATFIPGTIYDNTIGMARDPGYIANLKAQDPVNRARLLDGNWKIRPTAGSFFPETKAIIVQKRPDTITLWVRAWDLASTEPNESYPDPDYTVGVLLGRAENEVIVVADVIRFRKSASFVREMVRATAMADGRDVLIYIPQDPGQAGEYQIASYREWLKDFIVISRTVSKNKQAMAEPVAALWQSGMVHLVAGGWNASFIKELDLFPTGRYDDQTDALTGGVSILPSSAPNYQDIRRR